MPKTPLPDTIRQQMKFWRLGLTPIPQGYIRHHEALALASLEGLQSDYVVHSRYMDRDGWMDGMEVIFAVIEDRQTEELFKIKWNDSNEEFFQMHRSGGGSPLSLRRIEALREVVLV